MKEFERFNSKRGIDCRIRYSGAAQFGAYVEQEREDTWKAALEMIYYKGILDSTLAGDLIKEELPDGSV